MEPATLPMPERLRHDPLARKILRQARRRYHRLPPAARPGDLLGVLNGPDDLIRLACAGVCLSDAWVRQYITTAPPPKKARCRRLAAVLARLATAYPDDLADIITACYRLRRIRP